MRRFTISLLLAFVALPLASCANTPWGQALEQALKADDPGKLQGSGGFEPVSPVSTNQPATPLATQLPADFVAVVPRYPNATLREVVPSATSPLTPSTTPTPVITRWGSSDGGDRILAFYRQQLQSGDWQLDPLAAAQPNTLAARRGQQTILVTVPSSQPSQPSPTGTLETVFEIRYVGDGQTPTTAIASPSSNPKPEQSIPSFTSTTTLGASGSSTETSSAPLPPITVGSTTFTDLAKAPAELRQYVQDVAQLGILTPVTTSGTKTNQSQNRQFAPNKPITRREFARWLVSANNRLYGDRPAQQIRQGVATGSPAFRDVPRTDPDFATIQGLADAGIVPSRLSGDSTTVSFRPNAPLTRETLLQWKVPMDMRQALPTASIDAIKQTWGFQDATRIDPKALRAVLADYQNGDAANIRRAFGYTTLFQPKKAVTRAEAAAAIWYFGYQGDGTSAQDVLQGNKVGNQESGSQEAPAVEGG